VKNIRTALSGFALAGAFASIGAAQSTAPANPTASPVPAGPQVGQVAPDFTLPGATKYGLLKTSVRLSDFRGKTVVLAFFYQARTKG
jgi:hypothetical protein